MTITNYYRSPAQFTNPGCLAVEGSKLRQLGSKLSSVIAIVGSIPPGVTSWLATGWETAAPVPTWDSSGISLQEVTWKKFANRVAEAVKYGRVSDKAAFQTFLTEISTIGRGTAEKAATKSGSRTTKASESKE